jgi:hypothetical protein
MLIFSVSFEITKCPKAKRGAIVVSIYRMSGEGVCVQRPLRLGLVRGNQGSKRRVTCASSQQSPWGDEKSFGMIGRHAVDVSTVSAD